MIVEILSILSGSTALSTIVLGVLHYNTNKRLKEAEAASQEASAQIKNTEAEVAKTDGEHKVKEQLYDLIQKLNEQIGDVVVSSGDQIDLLNKHLSEELENRIVQTERLRNAQDELLAAKNEIILLTAEISMLKEKLSHYKNWMCERDYSDCQRRQPEQKIKCPYVSIE